LVDLSSSNILATAKPIAPAIKYGNIIFFYQR